MCVCKKSTRLEQKHATAFPRYAQLQRTAPSVFPQQLRPENYCSTHLTPAIHITTLLFPSPRGRHYMCHYHKTPILECLKSFGVGLSAGLCWMWSNVSSTLSSSSSFGFLSSTILQSCFLCASSLVYMSFCLWSS